MKKYLLVFLTCLFCNSLINASSSTPYVFFKKHQQKVVFLTQQNPDKDFVLIIIPNDSKRLVQISFNGNEGADGDLKIFDVKGNIVATFNFELIKFPNYATIDITNLPVGQYTAELTTTKAVHTADLTIK